MSKDIKSMLSQKLSENTTRHANAKQSPHLDLGNELKRLALNDIQPNRYQPRTVFDTDELEALKESIKEAGLLQPITVRPLEDDKYEIVAGERRFRAIEQLGKKYIDAIVRQTDDGELAVLALAENASRQDLCDYEIAQALANIQSLFPNKSRLAESIGLDRKELYRYLSYHDLPQILQDKLKEKPQLIARSAAYAIKSTLSNSKTSNDVDSAIIEAWELLETGQLDQGKMADFIAKRLNNPNNRSKDLTPIEVRPITSGDRQIGKFKSKGKKYTVEIDTTEINEEHRQQIEEFIQKVVA